ncbi:MAG: hypothetical protein AB8F78_16750 [Saprospiraceae bacterium]
MEPFLDILSSAQPVDAPQHMLAVIQQRIAAKRMKQRRWLRVAAAAAILLWGVEGYVLAKAEWGASDTNQIATIIPTTNNSLY